MLFLLFCFRKIFYFFVDLGWSVQKTDWPDIYVKEFESLRLFFIENKEKNMFENV